MNRLLTEKEIQKIHSASLQILEKTGVKVESEQALSLLGEAGADVKDRNRVKIPSSLIEKALESSPHKITVYNQDKEIAMVLAKDNSFYGPGSDCSYVIDPYTGKRREALKEDIGRMARVCDYLTNIDFVMSMGIPHDLPLEDSFVHEFEAMVLNTKKPIIFTAHGERDIKDIYSMAAIVAGSPEELRKYPFLILYSEPISPLIHSQMGTEKMLFCAEKGIPFIYIGSPMLGATAPVTLAGSLAVANAEALSGLLIAQLKREGAMFIYGGDITVMDMRTSIFAYGAPEAQILNAGLADLGHYYELPIFCMSGATDAKILDAQAGIEYASSILTSTLNGANIIHDLGYLESGSTSSLESIVLADEIVSMVKRITSGIRISEETLALKVIDRVGPGGNFLIDEHTLHNFKTAHWYPRFMDRTNYDTWLEHGQKAINDRLSKKVKRILAEHKPTIMSEDKKVKIKSIIEEREKSRNLSRI